MLRNAVALLDREITIRAYAHVIYKVICELFWKIIRNLIRNIEFGYYLIIQISDCRCTHHQWEVHSSRYIHRLDSTYYERTSRSNLELYLYGFVRLIVESERDFLIAHGSNILQIKIIPNIFVGC